MSERPPAASASTPSQQVTVLVVEDEPALRDVVRWVLEDEGFLVETAADGRQAVDMMRQSRPGAVVLDLGLPILNGEEVAAEMKRLYEDPPPIVVMTAAGTGAERSIRIGAAAHVAKPFDLDDLVSAVRTALQRQT